MVWWCGGGVRGADRSLLLLLLACLFGCMSLSIHQTKEMRILLMNYGVVSMMVMVMSCAAVAVAVAGTVQTRRYSVETTFQGSYQTPDDARKLFIQDNIAYVVDGDGLNIINVSNSSSPSLMGSYETPSFASDVFVQDYIAYVADFSTKTLLLIDVSNPYSPSLMSSFSTPSYIL